MKCLLSVVVAALLSGFSADSASAQVSVLSNADVIRLAALKLSDHEVINIVHEAAVAKAAQFDLSSSAVTDLAAHGVSPAAIAAMRPSATPAPTTTPPRTPPAATLGMTHTTQPLVDLNASSLPRGFSPDDPEMVFKHLSPPEKDEFETTAQAEARVGPRRTKSLYAFKVGMPFVFTYDADQQEFVATMSSNPCVYVGFNRDCSIHALPLKSVTTSWNEHLASNAYGATFNVTEVNEDKYSLYLRLPTSRSGRIQLQIKMEADEAREAKPDLGLLVITFGTPACQDLVSSGISDVRPTFSTPVGGTDHHYYLELTPRSLWVYNKKTGKIYQKFDGFAG
jgi:hypothetical protein